MINAKLLNETLRYLGVKQESADERLLILVYQALNRVETASKKQYLANRVRCCVTEDAVALGTHFAASTQMAKHLRGCEEAFLFAATLGAEVDRLLRRDAVLSPSLAAAEQAAAAAIIEMYCDEVCLQLETSLDGMFCRPRFSAGYGDLSLSEQPYILQVLDAPKRMGLSCTDSFMLIPTKSVTAVIGISKERSGCYAHGCTCCLKTDCIFRRTE